MRHKKRGMTLLEVLIAMLVMSVGMLGIAGLQATVNRYQIGSRVRGKMAPLLSDIADRILLNPTQAGRNVVTGVAGASLYDPFADHVPSTERHPAITHWCTQPAAAGVQPN